MKIFISVLAVGADNFGKGGNGNKQPAPYEVVCNPVISRLRNGVYGFADHNGVNKVVNKLLKSGEKTGF